MTCVHIDHSLCMRVIDAYARASGVVNADGESATHVREHAQQRWFCTTPSCGLSFTSARDVASHSKSTDGVHVVYVKTRCRKPFTLVCEACAVIDESVGERAAYAASAGGQADARDHDDLDLRKRLANRERYLEQFTCASSLPTMKKAKRVPRGLRGNVNLGNTCFMATVLQAFLATPSFASYFLAEKHREMNCKVRDCVACALDHYVERAFSQDEVLIPADLLYTWWQNDLSFARHAQQDAHEFFLMFLELVHANIKGRSSKSKPAPLGAEKQKEQRLLKILSLEHGENATDVYNDDAGEDSDVDDCENISKCQCVVHSAFAGVTQSDLLCNGCGAVTSSTLEDMLGLSLDVPFALTTPSVKLLECLSAFARVENMDTSGFSRRICPKCSSAQEMQKQMSLKRTPRMLVLHLKRFAARGSDGHNRQKDAIEIAAEDVNIDSDSASDGDRAYATGFKSLVKTDVHVEFPFTLDVSPWCASTIAARRGGNDDVALNAQRAHDVKYKYFLYAVIVHSGVLHGGHYTCYVKRNDDWFLCDDASVHRVDIDEVQRAQAYMLFYG